MASVTSSLAPEVERWTRDGEYFEYSKAANPIGAGLISRVPLADFPASLHEEGPTRIIPFDLSEQLGCPGPATSPALCANFLHIQPGEEWETSPNATSELYYVLRGEGQSEIGGESLLWKKGDIFTLPARSATIHRAKTDSAFYWIHDEPLLRYLGVEATRSMFRPTLYPRERADAELAIVEKDPRAASRSRVSVLLANKEFPQTRTVTHVIWSMFGVLPKESIQLPHHHESVALDLIIDCEPGCYTLIGHDLDGEGHIIHPKRSDWKPGSAFVTPPGLWHSHHNESGSPAHLLPIQDAGLHTYLRTLDIHFYHKDHTSYVSQKK